MQEQVRNICCLSRDRSCRVFWILTLLFLALAIPSQGIRYPDPYCRSAPLPVQIPITVNSTISFDLQDIFDGYNLTMSANSTSDHISIKPKYQVSHSQFNQSYNWTAATVQRYDYFFGLIANNHSSELVIGFNFNNSGIKVTDVVHLQDDPTVRCYDVKQVVLAGRYYAIIDCAVFRQGQLFQNEFMYVDLKSKSKVLGTPSHDVFVKYHHISHRHIELISDHSTNHQYIIRIITRDAVDQQHQNQTFIEFYMLKNDFNPQLIDIIDYTSLNLNYLSIADYHVVGDRIFVLAYNQAFYEISITPDQCLSVSNSFSIKLDLYEFGVEKYGHNDELIIAITNGHQVYKYEWSSNSDPVLKQKYGLMSGSYVEQILCNIDFVLVTSKTEVDGKWDRKHWIFSQRSTSYTHVYNVFDAPETGPAIMEFLPNQGYLHLFHEYNTLFIQLGFPTMLINPVDSSKAGKNETFIVTATSTSETSSKPTIQCNQSFTFTYLYPNDTSIIKTGFQDHFNLTVDTPDTYEIPLQYQYYGMNLDYDITFTTKDNSSIFPFAYVDKYHRAIFEGIDEIKPENIVWYQMFTQEHSHDIAPTAVYGLVQVKEEHKGKNNQGDTPAAIEYITHYLQCRVNVFDRDKTFHLNCHIITSMKLSQGKIKIASQMFQTDQRLVALVFEDLPNTVIVYYLWEAGFSIFGRKDYDGAFAQRQLTGVTIYQGRLFCTLEYSKSVEIFYLDDLKSELETLNGTQEEKQNPNFNMKSNTSSQPNPSHLYSLRVNNATPAMIIDTTVMKFFGVQYFAPVKTQVSPFHNQCLFIKTKTGIMAVNINQANWPELLFIVPTENILYDFEVAQNSLVIIHEKSTELWHLYTPLRRAQPPFIRETFTNFTFTIDAYDDVTADKLFYLVGKDELFVLNPFFTNTNTLYIMLKFAQDIIDIDAVTILDRDILFIRTKSTVFSYVIRDEPYLYVEWPPNQLDFNLSIKAHNHHANGSAYDYVFSVLPEYQTEIKPTKSFIPEQIKKLGHVRAHEDPNNRTTVSFNLTMNDSFWFQGNVFHYTINCSKCGSNGTHDQPIQIHNHVREVQQLVAGSAIYDMQSTFNGIYAQQYYSYIKTHQHNDSIHYIQNIPALRGEVCSKIVIGHQYVVSLCQTGLQVYVYITTLISDKPFTSGPYPTGAKAVNHAKIVGDILMIVDVDQRLFARQGGIYLYSLNLQDEDLGMVMIDYFGSEDLVMEGHRGTGHIAHADIHDAHSQGEYRLFITDARSGSLFIISFELSPTGHQAIYLSKKVVQVANYIPQQIKHPSTLRLLTANIHYYAPGKKKEDNVIYYIILTTSNWHHLEISMEITQQDDLKKIQLLRMFERIPWELKNYFKLRRSWTHSQFAVAYINEELKQQVVAVYEAEFIVGEQMAKDAVDREKKKNQTIESEGQKKREQTVVGHITTQKVQEVEEQNEASLVKIPLIPILGVHRINSTHQTAFAFHSRGLDTLLFTDVDGYNITQLAIQQNVTLAVTKLKLQKPQNVSITAHNPYTNYTFSIQVQYIDIEEEERIEIIWIIICAIGGFMIIGLVTVYAKQKSGTGAGAEAAVAAGGANGAADASSPAVIVPIKPQSSQPQRQRPPASTPSSTALTKTSAEENKQSLLTEQEKEDYINRTSVDPESVRGTIDLRLSKDES